MPAEAFVNNEVVRWARERAGLTAEQAAKKLDIKPDQFGAWEAGQQRPTIRQAQALA